MAVYGYCRVSTLEQANEGESLETQRRQIEGYAHMHGLAVDETLVERGVSGSVPVAERPEGARLYSRLHKGDVIMSPSWTACSARPSTRSKRSRTLRSAASVLTCSTSAATFPATASRSCS